MESTEKRDNEESIDVGFPDKSDGSEVTSNTFSSKKDFDATIVDGNRVVADCIRNLFMMDRTEEQKASSDLPSLEKYYTEALGDGQSGPGSRSSSCSEKTNCDNDSWGESRYDEGLVEYPDDISSLDEANETSSESSEDTVYVSQPNLHLPYINPSLYALHTIMEESCEESDVESIDDKNTSNHLPSQLEKYFSLAFVSEQQEGVAGRIPFAEVSSGGNEDGSMMKQSKDEKENLALMASSRLEKYFTSGLLEGSSVTYPPEFEGDTDASVDPKGEENNTVCHFEQENSDTVKRRKANESYNDALMDVRILFKDIEDVESIDESSTLPIEDDNSCSYMLGKLMMHIKSSTQTNKQSLNSFNEDVDALSLLETQISRLMQRVSPANFGNDEPSSTSSTCSSSTIGSTGNNSDCGSDTLESHEDSTDEEGNLDADSFRISTPKKRPFLSHRSHSKHNELLRDLENTNISEETIYFCKQLVESLKRMSENNSPEGPKPPSLEATIEGVGVAAELTNARQYIKEQIESLMHSVTLSQQSSPASGRPYRPPRRRVEAPSSSDAHDSSDLESPRPPNKIHSVSEKTPSESGSETTVSASISIPSYDDSDHTPTESEISHEMDELFTLLEGNTATNTGMSDYLPVSRILPLSESINSNIQVSMNGSKIMEEKKTENVINLISSFGKTAEFSTSKCLVNTDVAGFNVFVPNITQHEKQDFDALPTSQSRTHSLESSSSFERDCLTPKAEVFELTKNESLTSSFVPGLPSGQSSLSSTESKISDSGSQETLVGSRADLKESYSSVVSGARLFRSKRQYYSSTSEVDEEESLGRTEADSGVGTPVPNSLNSKEKASSENNLLLANYRATTKTNKVVVSKSTSKSASNIMELDSSSENKGGSSRDTGYYSFKSSEESVRSFDDSLASRASSVSLVFHKSLTSTETIPEVEEDSCSLTGTNNEMPEDGVEDTLSETNDTSKMSLSSGNIPDSVLIANPKSSTLPLNLRSKSHHLATNSLGSSHLRQRPFSSSFFSTSGVLRKLTALRGK